MSGEFFAAMATALWAGVLTSISPCPLATNIAALTYISKHSRTGRLSMLMHGGLYVLGRALAYVAIGFLIVKGLISAPSFSFFMQKYGNQAISPLLVLTGMYMLGMIGTGFDGLNFVDISRFNSKVGAAASLSMGIAFALAFCPISAALYFGTVIPLAARHALPFQIPLLYAVGTALPVLAIAAAVDLGFKKISNITSVAGRFDKYAKPATGWIFIAAGVYMSLKYIFGLI